ncbi:TonB-dependent receptor [Sulfurimonas lithotrophica]|uniref:TonB-dependent receptor n=1 Tax=Sulfurimonas lithotrophica TaxID=2590022 RepID=A0A5P8NXZ2_9BACT|nr:TonB-dependent receptor [Sulfurimonas lithotrophica]QFR48302.1 TonB-dependent receptor [Sulfurimonas lithotrophica]
MTKTIKLSLVCASMYTSLFAGEVELKDVVVTGATKSEQSIQDVTSNVTLISSEELEEKHSLSVVEILSNISGINIVNSGGLGSTTSVQLRGMSNSRTLVLIDGVRYQDPSSTSGASLSHLMASDIERIEIIKGAQSGIWGADASAGVINIITKSAQKGTHLRANIEYGSFKTKKYGATASYKNDDLELKLSANRITSDSFSVQAPNGENVDNYEDDPYENTTINFNAKYNITNDAAIKLNVTSVDALKDYDSFGDPNDNTLRSDIKNLLYSASYFQKIDNHNLELKYENSKFERDEIGTVAMWGTEYVKVFNGEIQNIELSDNYKYMKDSFLLFGLGASSDDVDYIMTDNSKTQKENKNNYIYLTNSNKFESLILSQSIRYDRYNNFDNKATGKLGLKYNFKKDVYLSSNFGTGYNTPNIVQELNPWGMVNPDLNPENSKTFDISLGYKGLELTYFYQKIKDLIEWYDPDGWGGNPAIYKNLDGESTFKGLELAYKQNLGENLIFNSNATYLNAKNKDGQRLIRRPKYTANASLDYYPYESLHLGLYANYVGERYDQANEQGKQTGKYTLANFTAGYTLSKYLDFYLKVDNISDRYYQEADGYATAGRSYYCGLNAKY